MTQTLLGKAAEQGDQKLAGFCKSIDILLFKVHADAIGFQKSDRIQTIHRVSGKAGEGLRDDEVDAATLAGGDHLIELGPLFEACAGDALVGVNTGHLPIRAVLNLLGVVGLLGFIAVELFLAVGGYAAVGRHTHLAIVVSK